MSETDETDQTSPEERVRRIEQETASLDHDMDRAREAVRRASGADSLASPGVEQSVSEAQPQPEGVRQPEPGEDPASDDSAS